MEEYTQKEIKLVPVFFTGAILDRLTSFNPTNENVTCGFACDYIEDMINGRCYTETFEASIPFSKVEKLKVGQFVQIDETLINI